ncbi:DUF192 domain-containing protein [Aquibacillus halophilus]|uniref:DUF192 domain-containing protein n=1 Tax=Aquibacillus halophilus TaxID=930132 RepID=A0A6A8DF47_9BACI|nr:DUF192 domain-containing protein [Aquibacillus halophilus]MRH44325.1 DUF192 domain-containing protein [Aquibacillus halophilus]
MKLVNLSTNETVATNIKRAYTFLKRLKGLMFTKKLHSDTGLHIKPCRSVHTFFMKYAIDVLYLDVGNQVIAIDESMVPGKVGKLYKDATSVIELPAGSVTENKIEIGHKLNFVY